MHDSTMSETAVQWLATLSEVRRQAARAAVLAGVQPPESDGQWYDVAEDRTENSDLETLDETGAWRGLQWLNAFEILVGCHTSSYFIILSPIIFCAPPCALH